MERIDLYSSDFVTTLKRSISFSAPFSSGNVARGSYIDVAQCKKRMIMIQRATSKETGGI